MKITQREFNRQLKKIKEQESKGFFSKKDIERKIRNLKKQEIVKAGLTPDDIKPTFYSKGGNATKKIIFREKETNKVVPTYKVAKLLKKKVSDINLVASVLKEKKNITDEQINDVFELLKNSREIFSSFNLHEFEIFFKDKKTGFRLNGKPIRKTDLIDKLLDYEKEIGNSYITMISFSQKGKNVFIEIDDPDEMEIPNSGFFEDSKGNTFILSTN
jgi:hypothetical protein